MLRIERLKCPELLFGSFSVNYKEAVLVGKCYDPNGNPAESKEEEVNKQDQTIVLLKEADIYFKRGDHGHSYKGQIHDGIMH